MAYCREERRVAGRRAPAESSLTSTSGSLRLQSYTETRECAHISFKGRKAGIMLRDDMSDALSGKAKKLFDEFNRSYLVFLAIIFVCLVCDQQIDGVDIPAPFWAFASVMGLTGLSIAARRCINSLLAEVKMAGKPPGKSAANG